MSRSLSEKPKNKLRYKYIKFLRKLGMNYQSIGNSFHPKISRQAVHQVVKNYERRWSSKKADA